MAPYTFAVLSVLAASAAAAPAAQFSWGGPPHFGPQSTTTTTAIAAATTTAAASTVAQTTKATSTVAASTTAAATKATTKTTTSAATTASASASASASGSGKRGMAYNTASYASLFSDASEVSWGYNWWSNSNDLSSDYNYVPLLWGTSSDFTSPWDTNAAAMIAAGSTHLMSFNEPDLSSQSNLTPAEAAAAYTTYLEPYAGTAKLGSPAVTNGGGTMGLTWLSEFITACSSCTIDFTPIHWYNDAGTASDFISHVEAAYALTGKPIWVTEFGLNSPATDAEIISFFDTVLPWLDEQSYVERYSYFMVAEDYLLTSDGSALSDVGSSYIS